MEEVMKHSLGRGNLTEEWFYVFYPININGFYADQIYLLWGKKNLCKFKVLNIAKDFFSLAQLLLAGHVSIPILC